MKNERTLTTTPILILCTSDELAGAGQIINKMQGDVLVDFTPSEAKFRLKTLANLNQALSEREHLKMEFAQVVEKEKTVIKARDSDIDIPGYGTFIEFLTQEWKRCLRYDWSISLLVVTIDYFQEFEDSEGKNQAQKLRKSIFQALQDCAQRPGDLLCVYKDGHPIAVLSETSKEGATHVAERMVNEVKMLEVYHPLTSGYVSVSIGVSSIQPLEDYRARRHPSHHDEEPAYGTLIHAAKKHLAQAIVNGGNQFVL